MRAYECVGEVDGSHHLQVELPPEAPTGAVRVLLLWAEHDESEAALISDWRAASNSSLREIWDNDEDAVYDHL